MGFLLGVLCCSGCASVPPLDNPVLVRPGLADQDSLIPPTELGPTPAGYAEVYDRTLDALDDYFEILPGSRHSGVIRTKPRIAPGYEQPWKPSSPSVRERFLATFQSVRHYAIVRIEAVEKGFHVAVEVYKELEVSPAAIQSPGGRGPIFRDTPTAEPIADVVATPGTMDPQWVAAGAAPHRDYAFEQAILRKIQRPTGIK